MYIGHKLKNLREQHRYSQQYIADLLQISQKTYSNIESDKSKISIEQLATLSKTLDFDFIDFLQEQGLTFNQSNNHFADNSNGIVINNFSNQLINQLELRLKEKDEIIRLLKEQIQLMRK